MSQLADPEVFFNESQKFIAADVWGLIEIKNGIHAPKLKARKKRILIINCGGICQRQSPNELLNKVPKVWKIEKDRLVLEGYFENPKKIKNFS